MKQSITLETIIERLKDAKDRIRIVGVAALPLPWESLMVSWGNTAQINHAFSVTIHAESDDALFVKSFTSDTVHALRRQSFESLKFARDRVFDDVSSVSAHNAAITNARNRSEWFTLKINHLPIPLGVVEIDDILYATPLLHDHSEHLVLMDPSDPWFEPAKKYADCYFDPSFGGKYVADCGAEILQLFDHKRNPRGSYPRNSFYDTDYSQLVVWALIFDRKGRILIHRREDNAKDNRSMWDKSVGGHVDPTQDTDTSRAALREVVEELFTDENKHGAEELTPWQVNDQDLLFLGEWRPDRRRRLPFAEVSQLHKEWAYFRLRDSQQLYSPRVMPSGGQRRLRVIADVFLFIAGPTFNDESIAKLQNSRYKLLELSELKSAMDMAQQGVEVFNCNGTAFDDSVQPPLFTPDLTNIMTGSLRGVLEEFSEYIKHYAS